MNLRSTKKKKHGYSPKNMPFNPRDLNRPYILYLYFYTEKRAVGANEIFSTIPKIHSWHFIVKLLFLSKCDHMKLLYQNITVEESGVVQSSKIRLAF